MAAREKVGIVIASNMKSTKIVAFNDRITHKKYKKIITKTKRYVVHDATFNSAVGDKVRIRENKPLSKTKNWILVNVLKKSVT